MCWLAIHIRWEMIATHQLLSTSDASHGHNSTGKKKHKRNSLYKLEHGSVINCSLPATQQISTEFFFSS